MRRRNFVIDSGLVLFRSGYYSASPPLKNKRADESRPLCFSAFYENTFRVFRELRGPATSLIKSSLGREGLPLLCTNPSREYTTPQHAAQVFFARGVGDDAELSIAGNWADCPNPCAVPRKRSKARSSRSLFWCTGMAACSDISQMLPLCFPCP